jgi:Zn-dependent protease
MKFILLLLSAGKLGKLLTTGGTMVLSVFAYALVYGWGYAVGLVGLIFVHEMGHFIAARRCGLNVGAPVFIPFVGAWVALKTTDLNAETEAYVALAGPVLGSVGAFACYLVALENGQPLWMAIAYGGFFINLFNLLPLRPLDGGRIVRAISARLWWVGLPVLALVFWWRPSPLLFIIGLLALPDLWTQYKGRVDASAAAVPPAVRLKYGAAYLGLLAGLAVMALEAQQRLAPLH